MSEQLALVPEAEKDPLEHDNILLPKSTLAKLNKLREINRKKINEKVRAAAVREIESQWRMACVISGQDPDIGF